MTTRLSILAIFLFLGVAACETADDPADNGSSAPDSTLDSVEPDTTTGATRLILENSHPGWEEPSCWNCHTADDHNDGKDPYLSVGCHGTNGAQAMPHGDRSKCVDCHDPLPHGTEGFPDPLSCRGCHLQ